MRLLLFSVSIGFTKQILTVAGPAGLSKVINPVGIAMVTAILARLGEVTVAAFGAALQIAAFTCLPMLAISSAIGPSLGRIGKRAMRGASSKHCAMPIVFAISLAG